MLLKDLLNFFEQIAPEMLQEDYDNCGLQIGLPNQEVSKGLICLDITSQVISEARTKGCDLIISHHPLIFKGLKRISDQSDTEIIVREAIQCGIAIVSLHTNFDKVYQGVNLALGQKLGIQNMRILDPQKGSLRKLVTFCPTSHVDAVRRAMFDAGAGKIGDYDSCSFNTEGTGTFKAGMQASPFVGTKHELHFESEVKIESIVPAWLLGNVVKAMIESHPYEEVAYDIYMLENKYPEAGFGMIGELEIPMPEHDFLELIKNSLQIPYLRHSAFCNKNIKKVAICGGSGSFLLPEAMALNAHAFVTAEIKYHQFFEASKKILLVDAGHFETEQFAVDYLYNIVNKKFSNFALLKSGVNTNPVCYF
ncbi:MAG TPA: Nif3-like dinuclear metal center hexameric protein [Bacteroidales bacterium]|nr:Nif3-like dinuclear metal center hexameric protein [Bacteroidales bacterium]